MTNKSLNKSSYKELIPQNLHQEVERLIDYLEYFPFEDVTYCHHCNSSNFYPTGHYSRPNKQLPQYYCMDCQKEFIQLTNTIFSRSWHLEKWGEIGRLYLKGLSATQVKEQTGISKSAVLLRFRAINQLMKESYPELYFWWHTHQERRDLSFSENVAKQASYFLKWLDELINRKDYTCPHCQHKLYKSYSKSIRPQFTCYRCNYHFNALNNTRFKRMIKIDLWIPYAQKLIEGYSLMDIERLVGISHKTGYTWKKVFISQIRDLQLNELLQWLTWQRKRRYAQIVKLNKSIENIKK